MESTETTRPITAAQISDLNKVAGDVDQLVQRIARESRHHATMNMSWRTPRELAEETIAAYERSTEIERQQARDTNDKIRRELGITEPTVWVV